MAENDQILHPQIGERAQHLPDAGVVHIEPQAAVVVLQVLHPGQPG